MKRALAERAKQSAAGQGEASSDDVVQTPRSALSSSGLDSEVAPFSLQGDRPLKAPRRENEMQVGVAPGPSQEPTVSDDASMNASMGRSFSGVGHDVMTYPPDAALSSNSAKEGNAAANRQAAIAPKQQGLLSSGSVSVKGQQHATHEKDNEENQQFSSFFLKHQNSALASELKSLRYQLNLLEKERDYRRKQCRVASHALNALQATWTQMETALQRPSQHEQSFDFSSETNLHEIDASSETNLHEKVPRSTGTGASVELVGSLLDALTAIGNSFPTEPESIDETDDGAKEMRGTTDIDAHEKQRLNDLSNFPRNLLRRANALEQWIFELLQRNSNDSEQSLTSVLDHRTLIKDLEILRGECRESKTQIEELAKARDDVARSERNVRRCIYRLSTGRVTIEQVLKDLENTDDDGTLATEVKMEALAEEKASAPTAPSSQKEPQSIDEASKGIEEKTSKDLDNEEMTRLRKEVEALKKQLSNCDSTIEELHNKLSTAEKRINELCSRELSDEDAQKIQLHEQSQKKLERAERELSEVREKLKESRENWARARGDADLAVKSLRDLQHKENRRWEELAKNAPDQSDISDDVDLPISVKPSEQAQKIIELEHKLKQALENVRQADTVRQNLKEALSMNASLQTKLEEIKTKYAALQAGRGNNPNNPKAGTDAMSNVPPSATKEKSGSSEKLDPGKTEKMHREHRRMRKEMAALVASKDAAKTKLERVEKERDSLMDTNTRLLRQSAEKDDMNAKSLSTILHLKNLTEQLTQGKSSLEQQLKSAGQLALASRLATNAKDRVAEEVTKEKEEVEKKLENCEERNAELKKELESCINEWSQADAKITILKSQLSKALNRSEELVMASEEEQKERRKLQDSLDKALRKAEDATAKLQELSKREGLEGIGASVTCDSAFTVEQLNTQVSVLKSRLACPVCHYRDKDCIIMRCRHMFCKHCVEENIQNRSRKCPSCGLKFSEKDVDDVWL